MTEKQKEVLKVIKSFDGISLLALQVLFDPEDIDGIVLGLFKQGYVNMRVVNNESCFI